MTHMRNNGSKMGKTGFIGLIAGAALLVGATATPTLAQSSSQPLQVPTNPDTITADIQGRYQLVGKNFRGNSYRGFVTVTRTGETYRVFWVIGRQRYTGIGIRHGNMLSVGYNGGLAVYKINGDVLSGTWAPIGSRRTSTEDWRRAR